MRGNILSVAIAVAVVMTMIFVSADVSNPQGPEYTLASQSYVLTTDGWKTIESGQKIGGVYADYVVLAQATLINTTEDGEKRFVPNITIDCTHEPWEPDPCN